MDSRCDIRNSYLPARAFERLHYDQGRAKHSEIWPCGPAILSSFNVEHQFNPRLKSKDTEIGTKTHYRQWLAKSLHGCTTRDPVVTSKKSS